MLIERTDHVPAGAMPDGPLASGVNYWYWRGDRLALDLVNTRRERWRRSIETLVTPADLSAWLVAAGVMEQPARVRRAVLAEAHALREAIDAAVVATVEGSDVPGSAIGLIDDWLVFAGPRPQLLLGPDGLPALAERPSADSPRRALGMVALDAATLLGTPARRARLRICASETCSARFYDRSPAARRRWCSMQTCGNQAKARRHRERVRGMAPA
jgi:predicted RNA-binding Zn ribbon-like protein